MPKFLIFLCVIRAPNQTLVTKKTLDRHNLREFKNGFVKAFFFISRQKPTKSTTNSQKKRNLNILSEISMSYNDFGIIINHPLTDPINFSVVMNISISRTIQQRIRLKFITSNGPNFLQLSLCAGR
jgi:hypothetical protein